MSQQSVEESMKKPKCYTAVITEGGITLGIAVEGEPGYYKTNYPTVKTWDEAVAWAHEVNKHGGIDEKEEFRIVASSIAAQHAQEAKQADPFPVGAQTPCPHCGDRLGLHTDKALGQHLLMTWEEQLAEANANAERRARKQAEAVDEDVDRTPDSDPDDYERDGP